MRINQFLFISLLLLLTGCIKNDSIFLKEDECNKQCWNNLSIGMKKQKAIEKLEKIESIDHTSYDWTISNDGSFDNSISWEFLAKRERSGSLSFKNDKVISMGLSYINSITLSEIINEIGKPDRVLIYSTISGRQDYTQVYIFFTNTGICTTSSVEIGIDSEDFFINPNLNIQYVFFTDPGDISNQSKNGCVRGWTDEELSKLETWEGYSRYFVVKSK